VHPHVDAGQSVATDGGCPAQDAAAPIDTTIDAGPAGTGEDAPLPASKPVLDDWWGDATGPSVLSGACGLDLAHHVVCWNGATTDLPPGEYKSISCMVDQCAALRIDGTVVTAGHKFYKKYGSTNSFNYIEKIPYVYESPVSGPFLRVESSNRSTCAMLEDFTWRCWDVNWYPAMPACDGCAEAKLEMNDTQPLGHYLQLRPGGCAIDMSGTLVYVAEARPDLPPKRIRSPAGTYRRILRCIVAKDENLNVYFAGRALRSDGHVMEFYNSSVIEADSLYHDRYTAVADIGTAMCGLALDGHVRCTSGVRGVTTPTIKFKMIDGSMLGGGIYGLTVDDQLINVQSGDATGVPVGFPKVKK
jgi:hypothetical protein